MENQPEAKPTPALARSFTKTEINLLPLKRYLGPVEVIADGERLRALRLLQGASIAQEEYFLQVGEMAVAESENG